MAKDTSVYCILLLGAKGAGKSTLLNRIVLGRFIESGDLALEDNYRKLLVIDGEQSLLEFLNIGDIEAYPAVRTQSLKACTCAMILYSVCSRSSFEQVSAIHQEIIDIRGGDRSFPICLVGNKKDEMEWREVSFQEGSELAERLCCSFEECSAKDGTNADKIVFDLVRIVRRKRAQGKVLQEVRQKREDEEVERKGAEERTKSSLLGKLFRR